MNLDLDTFLVALYSTVDDLYKEHFGSCKPRRPGAKPLLSDSEVLTLVICAQCLGYSERRLVRHASEHWRSWFPQLLSQSATNRRARDLAGVLTRLVPLVGEQLRAVYEPYEVFDGLPVPLMRRCRGKRHRLFACEAGLGRGGSDHDWFYGCRLLVTATRDGVITGFVLGPPGTQERWLAEAMLCWRVDVEASPITPDDLPRPRPRAGDRAEYVGPTGPIWPRVGVGRPSGEPYVVDEGFAGRVWVRHWASDYGALVVTSASYKGARAEMVKGEHRRWRHVIETVNGHLEGALHLLFPGARSIWGLMTRVAAKLAAFNLGIRINRLYGRPDFAIATLTS